MQNPWTPDYDAIVDFNFARDALAKYGFVDSTYGNDTCPSLSVEIPGFAERRIQLWIDYRNPFARENGFGGRQYGIKIECEETGAYTHFDIKTRGVAIEQCIDLFKIMSIKGK